MKEKIIEALNEKIDEVYADFQKQLGITSGDIDPWSTIEQDKAVGQLAETMQKVLKTQIS